MGGELRAGDEGDGLQGCADVRVAAGGGAKLSRT